jgi:hypothetical protein
MASMDTTLSSRKLSRYLVELRPAEHGFGDIQALTSRARGACHELTRQNVPIRLLRSVFVPEDASCFLLFEAASAASVEQAADRAALSVGPVSEALRRAASYSVVGATQ